MNALFQVIVVGRLMGSDLAEDFALVFPPFVHLPQKQILRDFPVQLVGVSLIDTVLELVVLSLETANHPIMIGPLITVALPKGLDEPIEQALIDRDPLDYLTELLLESFLPSRGLWAWPVIACAVVVNVFALLDLSGDGASAKGAREHTDERKLTLCMLGMIGLSECFLRLLPQGMGDNGGMAAMVELGVPQEIPVINRIFEDMLDRALG